MTSPNNPNQRARKPQQRSMALRDAIAAVAREYERMSVRQLFYQLVARGVIDKTDQAYKRVCDMAVQMRLDGTLHYRKISDGHRTRRQTYVSGSLQQALEDIHTQYRRDYWLDQPYHVEVWCEKDALSGVIQPVCDKYGLTYVATRGFPSLTLLYESAQAIIEVGKPAKIFYLGDHDASGQSISATLEERMRSFGADVSVYRLALDPYQISMYKLPTRPGKRTDSRYRAFAQKYGDACVELDAMRPDILTELVADHIAQVIDEYTRGLAMRNEELERETLACIASIGWEPGTAYHLVQGGVTK